MLNFSLIILLQCALFFILNLDVFNISCKWIESK